MQLHCNVRHVTMSDTTISSLHPCVHLLRSCHGTRNDEAEGLYAYFHGQITSHAQSAPRRQRHVGRVHQGATHLIGDIRRRLGVPSRSNPFDWKHKSYIHGREPKKPLFWTPGGFTPYPRVLLSIFRKKTIENFLVWYIFLK